MTEEWRGIPGSDGVYQVSDLGNVRSVDRVITDKNGRVLNQKGRLLRQATDKDGYKVFTPKLNGRSRWALVHQMVLLAFRGPMPEGMLTPYDASNTIIDQGWRRCRTCTNQQQNARRKANS